VDIGEHQPGVCEMVIRSATNTNHL